MTRADSTKPAPADELYLDSIGREGNETVVRMHGAEQTLGHMALAMRDVWSTQPEGTNYVELAVNHEGKAWKFAVYPAGKPTPHDKRREAEAKLDEMLGHYSAALDEIWRLRVVMEYEAQVLEGHLTYRTFPKSRRKYAEDQVQRLREAVDGNKRSHADVKSWVIGACGRAVGTLTRAKWEAR